VLKVHWGDTKLHSKNLLWGGKASTGCQGEIVMASLGDFKLGGEIVAPRLHGREGFFCAGCCDFKEGSGE